MDMSFLNPQWLAANWLPLVISLIIGIILGWLFTGISPRRKNKEYEAQIADMEAKSRKTERDLSDAKKQADSLKSSAAATESSLAETRKQLATAQNDLQAAVDQRVAIEADVQTRNIEAADIKMQLALLQDQFDKSKSSAAAEIDSLRNDLAAAQAKVNELSKDVGASEADLQAVRSSSESALQSLASKDAALNEAYQRVINLQNALDSREGALNAAQAELQSLRTEVAALNLVKGELEARLQHARGDVAGEMAVLTSTMLKIKEDQLMTANARLAELNNEISALKTSRAAG